MHVIALINNQKMDKTARDRRKRQTEIAQLGDLVLEKNLVLEKKSESVENLFLKSKKSQESKKFRGISGLKLG